MLTIQEGIERDELLDVDGRNKVFEEARGMIHDIYSIPHDAVGNAQTDQILADHKYQLIKKRTEALTFVNAAELHSDSEMEAGYGEEAAALMVVVALPQERQRIRDLLAHCPVGQESKTAMLAHALKQIWKMNPAEKVVIFATYLGTVETIKKHLDETFPTAGVDILRAAIMVPKQLHKSVFAAKMALRFLCVLLPDEKALTYNLLISSSTMICLGTLWTWNNVSDAFTGMGKAPLRRCIT